MRVVLSVVAILASGPALAQSIETVKSLPAGAVNDSVTRIACPSCPTLQVKKSDYDVPALATGKQRMELRTVSGKQKLYRTEAWLGGSPVVFVSTPSQEMIASLTGQPVPIKKHDPIGDGIDNNAKTAALPDAPPVMLPLKEPIAAAMQPPAAKKDPAKLDTDSFALRTN